MIGICFCCAAAQRIALGCGRDRVHLSHRIGITLFFLCVERIVGDIHQHIAGNDVFVQIRGCLSAGFPVQVCQRVIGRAVHQRTVCNVLLVCFHSHTACACFARLCAILMLISRCTLQEHFGHINRAGTCHSLVPGAKQHRTADGNQFSFACNAALVQLHSAAAAGIQCNVSTAAVGHQNRIICQRQGSVAHTQRSLSFHGAAGLIAPNEYLTLDSHVALCGNHSVIVGTVGQVAVGQIVGVRVNGCIFQNCTVRQTELSADGRAGFKFLIERIVVHGEGAAALHINDALHGGVPQRQLAAVFHHDADAAEDLHIHQGQVAAFGDIQGLGNLVGFYILPRNIRAQHAISAAGVGAVPDLQILRHADAVFFTVHIAAEVFDRPRLHDVPCVQTALVLLEILGFDLVCQGFLTGVDAEGERVAVSGVTLVVLNMNGYQIAARVLGRAIQRQIAAELHVDAFHAAVGIFSGVLFGIRNNTDGALRAIQIDFGQMIQLFPICVCRGGTVFHQGSVNRHGAVLVAGSTAGAGAGNTVVILLSDDGRLEAAFDLHIQLIGIAGFCITGKRCVAVLIDDQLEGQLFVASCRDGDDVTAFQDRNGGVGTVVLRCKNKAIVAAIRLVSAARGRSVVVRFPCRTVHGDSGNRRNIVMRFFAKGHVPVNAEHILREFDLTERNFLSSGGRDLRSLKHGGNRHILGRHNKGVLAIVLIHQFNAFTALVAGHRDCVQLITLIGSHGHSDSLARLGTGGIDSHGTFCNIRCRRYRVSRFRLRRCVLYNSRCITAVSRFLNFNRQILIAVSGNRNGYREFGIAF